MCGHCYLSCEGIRSYLPEWRDRWSCSGKTANPNRSWVIALLVSLSLHAVPYSYGYWETDTVIALMLFAEISKPSDMASCDVVGIAVYFNL